MSHPAAVLAGLLLLPAANYVFNHVIARRSRGSYVIVVVLLCGIVVPAVALDTLARDGILAAGSLAVAPLPIVAGVVAGLVAMGALLRGVAATERRRSGSLLIALFAPSLAEVLVFLGLLFNLVSYTAHRLVSFDLLASSLAVIVTAGAFALYHLTHAGPWRSARVLVTLFVVWLFLAAFYAIMRNLWAAALLNTALATVGFVRNRASGPDQIGWRLSTAFDLIGLAGVMLAQLVPV